MSHTERLAQLRENLVEYFSQEELRSLCFDLGVDWDRLRGEEKAGKVTALLTSLDNTGRVPELIERCTKLRPNIAWQEILQAAEAPSPFKGLQYFDEADADLFFGRELLTAQLVKRLTSSPVGTTGEGQREAGGRFLAVVGASGSGKSSVVRAGLVPALKRGGPLADGTLPREDSTRWQYHILTPGAHPLKELAGGHVVSHHPLILRRDARSLSFDPSLVEPAIPVVIVLNRLFLDRLNPLVTGRVVFDQPLRARVLARFTARLKADYDKSLDVLLHIKDQLAQTDALIDQVVYKLYGLSDAGREIAVAEGKK